jgi:hypothetical protein
VIRSAAPTDHAILPHAVSKTAAIIAVTLFFIMLLGLPLLANAIPN